VEEPSTQATYAAIKKSIANPAYLISFIDGKPYKTLKRHVGTHGMTPDEYRAKYGLPKDYPMVAMNTTLRRTQIALEMGLGRKKVEPAPVKKARVKPAVAAIEAMGAAIIAKASKPRAAKAIDPKDETFT
jgi:predicted transcriptional regulator